MTNFNTPLLVTNKDTKFVGTENRVMDTRGEAWGVGGKGRQNG